VSDWAIWGTLSFAAAAGIAACALLALRARQAWRELRNTRREILRRLDSFIAKAGATAEKAAAAGDTAELQESLGRLRVSLARLAVLRSALEEAQVAFGPVTAIVPRK
jgi:hypothetical protein